MQLVNHRVLAALLLCFGFAGAALASAEDELRLIEEQRRAAIRNKDFATLSSIYADDFLGVTSTGQLVRREELFRVFERTDSSLNFTVREVRVVLHGETAVFYGQLIGTTAAGTTVFKSRFSHVFVKRGGAWVCIAGQSTPMPADS